MNAERLYHAGTTRTIHSRKRRRIGVPIWEADVWVCECGAPYRTQDDAELCCTSANVSTAEKDDEQ